MKHVDDATAAILEASISMNDIQTRHPEYTFLLAPLITMSMSTPVRRVTISPLGPMETAVNDIDQWTGSDELIQSLMICIQDASRWAAKSQDKRGDTTSTVSAMMSQLSAFETSMRMPVISESIDGFRRQLSVTLDADLTSIGCAVMTRIAPFLLDYASVIWDNIAALASWAKASYKLCYLLCSLATEITLGGFCRPEEDGDTDAPDQNSEEAGEGTGFGQGTGNENVSEDVEDEAQVEGLQGEKEEESKAEGEGQDQGKDNAFEMQDDFGGDLESVVSGDESGDADDDDDEEGADAPDDHVGDVGEDAVDEQFWSGEQQEDKDDGKAEGKASEDNGEESEMAAKEPEPAAAKPKEKPDTKDSQGKEESEAGKVEDEIEDEGSAEQDEDEGEDTSEPQQLPEGGATDEHVPEVEPLALADDLQLDQQPGDEDDGMSIGSMEDNDDVEEDGQDADMESGDDQGKEMDSRDVLGEDADLPVDEESEDPEILAQDQVQGEEGNPDAAEADKGEGNQQGPADAYNPAGNMSAMNTAEIDPLSAENKVDEL